MVLERVVHSLSLLAKAVTLCVSEERHYAEVGERRRGKLVPVQVMVVDSSVTEPLSSRLIWRVVTILC